MQPARQLSVISLTGAEARLAASGQARPTAAADQPPPSGGGIPAMGDGRLHRHNLIGVLWAGVRPHLGHRNSVGGRARCSCPWRLAILDHLSCTQVCTPWSRRCSCSVADCGQASSSLTAVARPSRLRRPGGPRAERVGGDGCFLRPGRRYGPRVAAHPLTNMYVLPASARGSRDSGSLRSAQSFSSIPRTILVRDMAAKPGGLR
jgi:hypothetical protein